MDPLSARNCFIVRLLCVALFDPRPQLETDDEVVPRPLKLGRESTHYKFR
jgi:hypothetical protein